MTTFDTVWFWRGGHLTDNWHEVARFTSDTHPHPFLLQTDVRPDDDSIVTSTKINELGHFVVSLMNIAAPPLWFVYSVNRSGIVPMAALAAFANDKFESGTVLTFAEARKLGVDGSGRVGAISWTLPKNVLQQVVVDENWRRRKISTALIGAADTVIVALGDDRFLTGGEFTTADGEGLREAWSQSTRVVPRRGEVS